MDVWTQHPDASASVITRIEALGYLGIAHEEKERLEAFFATITEHLVDASIASRAIALRQKTKMRLGDAIIAATAVEHGLSLVTRNVEDFKKVEGLNLINPFDQHV